MPNIRMSRIDSEIQKQVATIIDALVRDNNYGAMITIQTVKTTPDLLLSTIYVTVYGKDSKQTIDWLTDNKAHIRRELAQKIRLKILPDLKFKEDNLENYASHMNDLFESIKGDK